jgi:hypothetical protein
VCITTVISRAATDAKNKKEKRLSRVGLDEIVVRGLIF